MFVVYSWLFAFLVFRLQRVFLLGFVWWCGCFCVLGCCLWSLFGYVAVACSLGLFVLFVGLLSVPWFLVCLIVGCVYVLGLGAVFLCLLILLLLLFGFVSVSGGFGVYLVLVFTCCCVVVDVLAVLSFCGGLLIVSFL